MRTIPLKELRVHVPHYYRCPISLDLMRDPVTLSTGQTYDRSSIEKWLSDGNLTCPVTRQPLQDLTLIPNHMLLRLIQGWCVENKSHGVERVPTPKQPATSQQVALLTQQATSSSSRQERAEAMRRLKGLAKESERNRRLIAEMGVAPLLTSAIFTDAEEGEEVLRCDEVTEEALGALVVLPLTDKITADVAQPERLKFVSHMLRHSSMEVRVNAATLLEALTSSEDASDQLRAHVGATKGLLGGLIVLLQETHYSRAVKVGVRALFGICLSSCNWEKAVAAGAASALVECLMRVDKGDKERALATIELLCKTAEGREVVGGHALSIPVLKKVMLKVSDQASENAAGILLAICSSSEKVQEEAVEEGIFTQLLLLLQSECTSRAKKKARTLLKLLRDNWADHPCVRAPGRVGVVPF